MTLMPTDMNNHPIPAVRMKSGGAHSIASGAASARNASAFDENTKIISLYATEDVFINFGDDTVTAGVSDHFFPKGTYYDVSISAGGSRYTHIAVLQVSAAGTLYISEKN